MTMTQSERPDADKIVTDAPTELGPVRAWSYSTLKKFETCPYQIYIEKVKRVPQDSSPAADRGSAIHLEAEDYVKGELGDEVPKNLQKFQSDFEELRALYEEGKVELEGEWGFDIDMQPVGWLEDQTWGRIKLDAMVLQDETSARVIDYKTGRKDGNEIPHSHQALLYAIGSFYRYPNLEYAQTELWYLDKGETMIKNYTRNDAMIFAPGYYQRAIRMTTATDFGPTPSKQACRWCSYRKGDEPQCIHGIS